MPRANIVFLGGLLLTCACHSEETGTCDSLNFDAIPEDHPIREVCQVPERPDPDAERSTPSGEWRVRRGKLVCDGYLTRQSGVDYCSDSVPDDWRRLEFNGKTYYVQPLS